MALTIVVTDDHDIIRAGIKNLIHDQPNYKVVAEARDGEEALEKIEKHKPDILLLDITMPKLSGLDVIEQVHCISPKTKVLVISVHKAHIYAMKAFQSGAKGYLNKANAGEELLPALAKIVSGEVYLTSSVSTYLVEKALHKSTDKESEQSLLTLREQEVLRLVAEGKTAKEIAATLFISRRTVENYKNTLLKKLELHKTSDLIKYAIKHKIVELEDEEY
ncbi:MAG: response regulator transcription factor [Candidatus Orphnella occulta]|nr:response regulator transcription factor [Candidatus Orphnella occulta]